MPDIIGKVLSRYRILGKLGEGGEPPLLRFLGTPEKDKRHIIFEGGHAPLRVQVLIKDILDWLDRYLGPVKTAG